MCVCVCTLLRLELGICLYKRLRKLNWSNSFLINNSVLKLL